MDKLIDKVKVALKKGKQALKDKHFTISYIYIEAARLLAELVREESPYQNQVNEADKLVKECKSILNEHREVLLAHESRMLLQVCFYNYLFVWAQANNQIPHRRMIIFDKQGYWMPSPDKGGAHVFIGSSDEEAMRSLKDAYEELPVRYRTRPLNPLEE